MNSFFNNQTMMNQLLRQKDNIENMIQQYSQPQPPVQNIINTNPGVEFEARILTDDEIIDNIFINRKTMFLDKKNAKVVIKDIDGKVLEQYELIIPLDEKDKKILDLETRLKEMEAKFNEYTEPIKPNNEQSKSNANDDVNDKPTTKTRSRTIQDTD